MMGQMMMDAQQLEQLATAIARELLRELRTSALDTIAEPVSKTGIFDAGPLTIDTVRYEARLHGEVVDLKPREFALLSVLAQNAGRVFTRQQLLDLVWPADVACGVDSDRTVDVHVSRVRRQLGKAAKLIRTITGVGYKLQASQGSG